MSARLLVLGNLVLLLACNGAGSRVDATAQGLDKITCPSGQVPWDFNTFRGDLTSEAISQLRAATGDNPNPPANRMTLETATCSASTTDVLPTLGKQCDFLVGKPCSPDGNTQYQLRMICPGQDVNVTYHCASAPTTHLSGKLTTAQCAAEVPLSTKCVPENCYGHTRRDEFMQCAPDLIKPVESKATMTVNLDEVSRSLQSPGAGATGSAYKTLLASQMLSFDRGQLYRFKGSVDVSETTAPRQLFTLWLKSTVPAPGASDDTLGIFRCTVGRIDLSKYTPEDLPGGGKRVRFDETLRLPTACEDGAPLKAAIKAGWASRGYDVTGKTAPDGVRPTSLMASYDLEGQAIVTPVNTPVESTCVPRPLDMFYNFAAGVHDSLSYYQQDQVPVVHRGHPSIVANPVFINAVPENLMGVTRADVPILELRVNKAGRARGEIDANLTSVLSGPDADTWAQFIAGSTNIFSSTARTLLNQAIADYTNEYVQHPKYGNNVTIKAAFYGSGTRYLSLDSYQQGAESGATALFPVPDATAKDPAGNVIIDAAGIVRLDADSLKASFQGLLNDTGTNGTMKVPISNRVRQALFNPSGRYPLKPGGTQNYVLQVCGVPKVYEDIPISLGVCPSSTECYWETKTITFRVALPTGGTPGDVQVVDDSTSIGLKAALNNCARSGVFAFRGENIVTPLPEVDVGDGDLSDLEPTSSGDDNVSATVENNTAQACSGAHCETTAHQSLGGPSEPVAKSVLSIVNDETEDDTTNKFETTFNMFGFDVLDAVQNGSVGPVKTVLTLEPNYEAIAEAFHKPFPAFDIEAGHVGVGVSGLSVEFEYKVPLEFGPVQGVVIFGAGVGAGMNVEVGHEYNPHVESSCAAFSADGGAVQDGCPDPVFAMPSLPFIEARNQCYYLGGTLAEPRSDSVAQSMNNAIPSGEEIWVGAQVGNEYRDKTDCAISWSSAVCAQTHKMYMRWLSDAETFQLSDSFGAFTRQNAPATILGASVTSSAPPTGQPVDRGVTMQGTLFRVRDMAEPHRSVCKRPLISTGTSHTLSIALNVVFEAGVSVAFCTPSDEVGICLEGGLRLIEAKVTPSISLTHTSVKTNAGASASATKFNAKVEWGVNLLTGSVEVRGVTPFGSVSYPLFEYEGFNVANGELANFEYDIEENFR